MYLTASSLPQIAKELNKKCRLLTFYERLGPQLKRKKGTWGQGQLVARAGGRGGDQTAKRRGSPAFTLAVQRMVMPRTGIS